MKLVCALKPSKPRCLCLNAGPVTHTQGSYLFREQSLNFSEGNWDSERQQKSPPLQRAAEGRVKEPLSPPFPKTRCLHAQKLWHSVTCTNPFFPLLYLHVLCLRLSTPQPNRYHCISNQVLRGFGMLGRSPGSHTGMINAGRYLRVRSGDWAGTGCTCRGAVPRRAGDPAMSSRGVTGGGWLVLGPQPRRIIQMQPQLQGMTVLCIGSELSTDLIATEITAFSCNSHGQGWSAQTK